MNTAAIKEPVTISAKTGDLLDLQAAVYIPQTESWKRRQTDETQDIKLKKRIAALL